MENTFWIRYPGDFELYHAMKQNFSRVERGFGWPAFWKSEGFRNRVALRRVYEMEQETSFTVFSNAVGHVLVTWENGEKKYPFGKKITAGPGKVRISIHAGCVEAFPCAYVQGEVIHSDKTWTADGSFPACSSGWRMQVFHQAGAESHCLGVYRERVQAGEDYRGKRRRAGGV